MSTRTDSGVRQMRQHPPVLSETQFPGSSSLVHGTHCDVCGERTSRVKRTKTSTKTGRTINLDYVAHDQPPATPHRAKDIYDTKSPEL